MPRCNVIDGVASVLCIVLVLSLQLGNFNVAAFMMPGAPLARSIALASHGRFSTTRSNTLRFFAEPAPGARHRRGAGRLSAKGRSKQQSGSNGREARPIFGAATGERGDNGKTSSVATAQPGPVVYAQDVLDRAWLSKRRMPAQGKGAGRLGQRFLTAFGARPAALFVEDRQFMESTLDNVVRVGKVTDWTYRYDDAL